MDQISSTSNRHAAQAASVQGRTAYDAQLAGWAGNLPGRLKAVQKINAWIARNDSTVILDLSHLELTSLPPLPDRLSKLKADHNLLESLPENVLSSIQALDLHNNKLIRLPETLALSRLEILNLANNSLTCFPANLYMLNERCKVYVRGNSIPEPIMNKLFGPEQNDRGLRFISVPAATRIEEISEARAFDATAANTGMSSSSSSSAPRVGDGVLAPTMSAGMPKAKYSFEQQAGSVYSPYRALLSLAPGSKVAGGYAEQGLYVAAANGQTRIVEHLLKMDGIDSNWKDSDGCTALFAATGMEDAATVKVLLAFEGIDPNDIAKSKELIPPICVAANLGNLEIARLLLSHKKTDPNAIDFEGSSALQLAVKNGNEEMVKLFLTHDRIDPNYISPAFKVTALFLAVIKNFPGLVAALLDHPKTDLNVLCSKDRSTALFAAIYQGSVGIAEQLIASPRLDPNVRSGLQGVPPLCYVISKNYPTLLALLIAHEKIDLDQDDYDGVTPLNVAAVTRKTGVVACLLEKGASLEKVPRALQKSVVQALGQALFETLSAPSEFLHTNGIAQNGSSNASFVFSREQLEKYTQLAYQAQLVVNDLKKMPDVAVGLRLAAISLYSIISFDQNLGEHPFLEQAITMKSQADGVKREQALSAAKAALALWDGRTNDGSGQASFSILKPGNRDRLPAMSRDILKAWHL